MASARIKGITIEIGGDTTKLTKALSSVDSALSNTQRNLRDLNNALKLDPTNTALLKDKQRELAVEIADTKTKLETEKEALDQLKHSDGFDANSKEARNLQAEVDLTNSKLKSLQKEMKTFGSVGVQQFKAVGEKMQDLGGKIKDVGEDLTRYVTIPIATAFAGSVKAAVDWESAFTGVMKTVDETANTTYEDLKRDINEIARTTASSQNEIAAVMEIGGQLGVTADDLTEFTQIMIELGDTTNLSSDQAASAVAQFANITHMSLKDVDKLGAVIVDLGNHYATTEEDILEMGQRLAGAGAQIGLSQGEILGLSTALSSVGINAEMGGSAFSKAMIKMQVAVETGFDQVNEVTQKTGMSLRDLELMSSLDSKGFKELCGSLDMTTTEMNKVISNGKNLENFADVAGMKTEDFVKLYRDDAPAALQAFIVGLGDTEGKGESTIAMLDEMGFTEVRLRDTLTRLANAQGLVTDAMAQGNAAWDENSALSNEAEKRYATMEAKMQQLKNSFTEVAVQLGEMLLPYVQKAIDFIGGLIEKWESLDQGTKDVIVKVAAIAAVVGPLLVVIGSIITAIGSAIVVVTTLVGILGAPVIAIGAIIAALVALGVAIWANWDKIKEWCTNVTNAVKDLGHQFYLKLVEIRDKVSEKIAEIVTKTVTKFTEMKTKATDTFVKMKQSISDKVTEIKNSITEGFQKAIDWIKSLPEQAFQWGADIIGGIVDGIKSMIGKVGEAAEAIADKIREYIHFSVPDKGPLHDFKSYMPDMVNEMVKGINAGIPKLESAMSNAASAMMPNGGVQNKSVNNTNSITMNVYGAQGQSVEELYDVIQNRMNQAVYKNEAVFA